MAADLTLLVYSPENNVAVHARKVIKLETELDQQFNNLDQYSDTDKETYYKKYVETSKELTTESNKLYQSIIKGEVDSFSVGADYGVAGPIRELSKFFNHRDPAIITKEFISSVMVTLNTKDEGRKRPYGRFVKPREVKNFLLENLGKECTVQFW